MVKASGRLLAVILARSSNVFTKRLQIKQVLVFWYRMARCQEQVYYKVSSINSGHLTTGACDAKSVSGISSVAKNLRDFQEAETTEYYVMLK